MVFVDGKLHGRAGWLSCVRLGLRCETASKPRACVWVQGSIGDLPTPPLALACVSVPSRLVMLTKSWHVSTTPAKGASREGNAWSLKCKSTTGTQLGAAH